MSIVDDLHGMYDQASQTLTLDTSKLGTLGASLQQMSGSVQFKFTGVTAAPAENEGTVSFSGSLLQLEEQQPRLLFPQGKFTSVRCDIYQADTAPVLIISAVLAQGWSFEDSIPWLAQTFWSDLAVKSSGDAIPTPALHLSTGDRKDPVSGVTVPAGVSFYGAWDETKGLLDRAEWIIGSSPVGIGTITLRDNKPPSLSLAMQLADAAGGFSGVFKQLKIPVEARLVYDPVSTDTTPGLHLTAYLNWAGAPVKVEAVIPPTDSGIVELSLIGTVPLPSPDDIANYLGGTSVTQYLPQTFADALNSIHVGSLSLGIGLGTKSLEYAKVKLTALEDKPLVIIPKWVEISNIAVSVTVNNPLTSPSASYKMSGILEIGGVDFLVSASLVPTARTPDLTVIVEMEPWSEIDLTMIAEHFGLPTGAFRIVVDEFQMGGSTSGTFHVRAALSEHPLGVGDQAFVMSNLIFELDYDGQTNFSLEGTMAIGGVDAYLSLSGGSGWNIQGKVGEETPIHIGDLIADLGAKFGIAVPAPVKSIDLRNIEFSYYAAATAATPTTPASSAGSFFFTVEGDFTVESTPVAITITIHITPSPNQQEGQPAQYDSVFGGTILIGSLAFDLVFDSEDNTSQSFLATFSRKDGSPVKIAVHDLIASLSTDLASVIPTSLAIELRDVKFVMYKDKLETKFALGLDLDAHFSPTDLPLIGGAFPAGDSIGVNNLQILYASKTFTPEQAAVINKHLPSTVHPLPAGMTDGLNASADMLLGGKPQTLALPMSTATKSTVTASAAGGQGGKAVVPSAADSSSSASSAKWFNVQQTFGPVSLSRLGVSYESGSLWFLLDGSLTVSGLTISLAGMGFGSPLDKFVLQFQLHGMGIDYKQGPLEIGGSFLEVTPPPDDVEFMYDGGAVIRTANFALDAIGSYAQMKDGQPSMFVFAQLEAPLGGPPALFITGLSAGFGYNRTVEIPAPEEVFAFPLLALSQDNGPKPTMMDVLAILEGTKEYAPGKKKAWIRPDVGEYWLAAGIEFWSFELLHTRALLIGKFGKELELALLGLSSIRLPQTGDKLYAYAELMLEADWKPAAGFFGLTAILTPNSFLIDPNCHLTGGFAFYLWYEGDREGQFVVTLGGYHPKFTPPAYYPRVPRVGFNWTVSDKLLIKGEAYFALTPAAVMAGGGLEVLFHDGDLKAWFTAHADMLITFHPFHYLAEMSVSIGASYRLHLLFVTKTISVELGASLSLWGPPTGGTAHVHWWIISFTVSFGAGPTDQQNTPIEWTEFKPLLPDLTNACTIAAVDGLVKAIQPEANPASGALVNAGMRLAAAETEDNDDTDAGKKIWLVRTDEFRFTTQSAIPVSTFKSGAALNPVEDPNNPQPYKVQIRPMNLDAVDSQHHITVMKDGSEHDISDWTLAPHYRNMPTALWGAPLKDKAGQFIRNPQVPSSNTVPAAPAGLTVAPPLPKLGHSAADLSIELLQYDDITPHGEMPLQLDVTATADYAGVSISTTTGDIASIMGDAKKQRDAIYAVLQDMQVYSGSNDSLSALARDAGHAYADSPMQV